MQLRTGWLGIHGAYPKFSGKAYQDRFVEFTELLLGHGFVVVLDLHWTNSTVRLQLLETQELLRQLTWLVLPPGRPGRPPRQSDVAQLANVLGECS